MRIFEFSDYRDYLKEVHFIRKQKNPSYSFRQFSKDMGFKSPGYIKHIIEDKHSLSERGAEKICSSLKLNQNETDYFFLLVERKTSNSSEKLREISDKLEKIASNSHQAQKIDHKLFFTNRMCGVLIFLVKIYKEKFIADPVWIMNRTTIDCSIPQIREALRFLIDSQYIVNENGCYVIKYENFYTSDEERNENLRLAHMAFLKEASASLSLPLD